MRKMLEELFYGNITPNERSFIRNTDFDRSMRIFSENEAKLTELLDDKEKTLFLGLVNATKLSQWNHTCGRYCQRFPLRGKNHGWRRSKTSTDYCPSMFCYVHHVQKPILARYFLGRFGKLS